MSKSKIMDELIKQMIAIDPSIVIVLEDAPSVFIAPVILTENSTEDAEKIGQLEYQVSDGMPLERAFSHDVYTWEDAEKSAFSLNSDL